MSRWFVGSSISSTSGRPSSTRAIATRIFQPPESAPTSPSIALVVEAEAVQHLARLRLELVAAEVVVLLLHLAEALEDPVHLVGARRVATSRAARSSSSWCRSPEPAAAGDRLVEHRAARHLLDVLAEVADGQLLRDRDLALVGRLLAHDHAEERRLAGAVRARRGRPSRRG